LRVGAQLPGANEGIARERCAGASRRSRRRNNQASRLLADDIRWNRDGRRDDRVHLAGPAHPGVAFRPSLSTA
jgi:hypothetical protein